MKAIGVYIVGLLTYVDYAICPENRCRGARLRLNAERLAGLSRQRGMQVPVRRLLKSGAASRDRPLIPLWLETAGRVRGDKITELI